jgi:hypothetical protein
MMELQESPARQYMAETVYLNTFDKAMFYYHTNTFRL